MRARAYPSTLWIACPWYPLSPEREKEREKASERESERERDGGGRVCAHPFLICMWCMNGRRKRDRKRKGKEKREKRREAPLIYSCD